MSAPAGRWVLRVDGVEDGPTNMAVDHALALVSSDGTAFLRLYRWDPPTLSLGRNEPARGRYDPEGAASRGIGIVRRPTGGRAVLHHREVTYAVAAPIGLFGGPRAAYRAINEALVKGLGNLGVRAALAEGDDGAPDDLALDRGACFRTPAEGEVVSGGRKLVGSAQVRVGDALLQHGSILLEDDQGFIGLLERGAGHAEPPAPAPGASSLAELLGRAPPAGRVSEAVAEGFRETLGGRWTRASRRNDLPRALLERYRSAEWTWRR